MSKDLEYPQSVIAVITVEYVPTKTAGWSDEEPYTATLYAPDRRDKPVASVSSDSPSDAVHMLIDEGHLL